MSLYGTMLRRLAWSATLALLLCPHDARAQADLTELLRQFPARPPFPEGVAEAKAAIASRSEKIDPALLRVGDEVRSKGIGSLESKAVELGVSVSEDLVLVTLYADDADEVGELEEAVQDLGGEVQTTFDNAVFARLPANAIERLDGVEELWFAAPQGRVEPKQVSARSVIRSEGVAASKIEHLHRAGVRGKGVKVGILDFGFQGLAELVKRGELPQPKATKSFPEGPVENGQVHGTACAEIVHDMAPDAELYLASVGDGSGGASDGNIVEAAQWLASQKVDIISFSGGGHFGPHDGTSLLDSLVDEMVQKHGIVWVNAAGNEGDEHWGGDVQAGRQGTAVEIGRSGNYGIALRPMRGSVTLLTTWNDWGEPGKPSSTQDLDAFLFAVSADGQLRVVAQSTEPQAGRHRPFEFIHYQSPNPNQLYVLAFRATNVTRRLKLHVYALSPLEMAPKTATGSIGLPATSRHSISVGAVNVTKGTLEPFSSQGPTDDGRMKPEVTAADMNLTAAYRSERNTEGRFPGTSAACPHVSGFAALLKQMQPKTTTENIRTLVMKHVRDMGARGPDNEYGNGHIDGSGLNTARTSDEDGDSGSDDSDVEGVPEAFSRSGLTVAHLDALWRIAQDAPADEGLKVVTGQRSYRVGDGMRVALQSARTCYYMLVHRSARGDYTVLAPTGDEAQLEGGERYALPRGEAWTVSEPIGEESLLLACSARPIDLARWIDNPDGAVRLASTSYEVRR